MGTTLEHHLMVRTRAIYRRNANLQPTGRSYNTIVFFRRESRPQCFFAPENERILFSPGTVEMGGIGIVANRESFDRITPEVLRSMIQEVADDIFAH